MDRSGRWVVVGGLGLLLACRPDPSSGSDDGSGSGASSGATADAPGCGDGVHEPGEVCYERVETDRYDLRAYGLSVPRDGGLEGALAIVSLPDVGLDVTVDLWQVAEGDHPRHR